MWLEGRVAGGKAAGNVLGAADLGLPSPGAAAAWLPGTGMCGKNQKSWQTEGLEC